MSSITTTLLVVVVLFLRGTFAVQAQEEPASSVCLPEDEVMLLANERIGVEPGLANLFVRYAGDRGATWRYTPFYPEDLIKACVERVNSKELRVNGMLYRWVGLRQSGHWYRILSVIEESGPMPYREDVYEISPREPKRIKVTIDAADFHGPVEMLRFAAPIRVVRWGVWNESHEWVRTRRFQFAFRIPAKRLLTLIPTCVQRPTPKNCSFPTTAFDLVAEAKYHPLVLDFMEDAAWWQEVTVRR